MPYLDPDKQRQAMREYRARVRAKQRSKDEEIRQLQAEIERLRSKLDGCLPPDGRERPPASL